jgi:CRP-like cAMP-binding protein
MSTTEKLLVCQGTVDWGSELQSHPEVAILPPAIMTHARIILADAGGTLFLQGQKPQSMLFVTQGELRLVRRSLEGAEVVLQRVRRGFVAEASLEAKQYHCDLVASLGSRMIAFPIGPFKDALRHNPTFSQSWTSWLAQQIRKLRSQCERLSLHSAADRVFHYIESEGTDGCLALSQSKKEWAAELGLTHESLYRTLSSLEKRGQLAMEKQGRVVRISIR